jgi:hypothetical protein
VRIVAINGDNGGDVFGRSQGGRLGEAGASENHGERSQHERKKVFGETNENDFTFGHEMVCRRRMSKMSSVASFKKSNAGLATEAFVQAFSSISHCLSHQNNHSDTAGARDGQRLVQSQPMLSIHDPGCFNRIRDGGNVSYPSRTINTFHFVL